MVFGRCPIAVNAKQRCNTWRWEAENSNLGSATRLEVQRVTSRQQLFSMQVKQWWMRSAQYKCRSYADVAWVKMVTVHDRWPHDMMASPWSWRDNIALMMETLTYHSTLVGFLIALRSTTKTEQLTNNWKEALSFEVSTSELLLKLLFKHFYRSSRSERLREQSWPFPGIKQSKKGRSNYDATWVIRSEKLSNITRASVYTSDTIWELLTKLFLHEKFNCAAGAIPDHI